MHFYQSFETRQSIQGCIYSFYNIVIIYLRIQPQSDGTANKIYIPSLIPTLVTLVHLNLVGNDRFSGTNTPDDAILFTKIVESLVEYFFATLTLYFLKVGQSRFVETFLLEL